MAISRNQQQRLSFEVKPMTLAQQALFNLRKDDFILPIKYSDAPVGVGDEWMASWVGES